jgi:hypothetical protein
MWYDDCICLKGCGVSLLTICGDLQAWCLPVVGLEERPWRLGGGSYEAGGRDCVPHSLSRLAEMSINDFTWGV